MQARRFILIAVCVLTLAAGTSVVLRAELQEEQSKADLEKELQGLLQERVKTAELEVEAVQAAFDVQRITLDIVLAAEIKLMEARLAVATTPEQEIDLLEKRVELMQMVEQKIKVRYDRGIGGGEPSKYRAAQFERQSAQIVLIKARLKAKQ